MHGQKHHGAVGNRMKGNGQHHAKGNANSRKDQLLGMAKLHKHELDAAGFTVEKDGHIKIDEALIIQSANEGTLAENLQKLNSFKGAMVRRADNISINPMAYVDKKLIAYPHPTKNYPNPYVTSRYSGMMFSTVV